MNPYNYVARFFYRQGVSKHSVVVLGMATRMLPGDADRICLHLNDVDEGTRVWSHDECLPTDIDYPKTEIYHWSCTFKKNTHGEYVVRCFKNNVRYVEGDYFTNDKEDAKGTLKDLIAREAERRGTIQSGT